MDPSIDLKSNNRLSIAKETLETGNIIYIKLIICFNLL